jgi:peroxiredoxin Q/BCP
MFPSPLLKPGVTAPSFHLLDQNGLIVTLERAQRANGLVLLFFASHFLPKDLQMLKDFSDAYPQFLQKGMEVLAISGLNWETLHHLANWLDLPYPVLFDPCCRVSTRYNAMTIPKFVTGRAVYVVHPDGTIRFASPYKNPRLLFPELGLSW